MIAGYQGKGLDDPDSVLATAKHYAGYSETQGGRDASEADLSRRKLLSYFLPPFERAAKAGCMTFMTGYQSIEGVPSTANRWLLVDGESLDDLVTRAHQANSLLKESGWGPQLLCTVFGFLPKAGADASAVPSYLVYLFKRGTFYPFCPTGPDSRDNEAELRLRAVLTGDLPLESDLGRWMALWGLPV